MGLGLLALTFTSCEKDEKDNTPPATTRDVVLKFEHIWGPNGPAFDLGTEYSHPLTDQLITFTTLRYYISNVVFVRQDGSEWAETESYYIVDVSNPDKTNLTIKNVPVGEYKGVKYTIGVDSTRNTSGVQTGALDPAEGMFWSWNTGYIFIKAEGNSPSATGERFIYHLGGFVGDQNAINTRSFDFGQSLLNVQANASTSVHFIVNAARFWHGGVSLEDVSTVHMPGPNAVSMAANFSNGILFDHVHN
jgi:hypothetical protein